MGVGIVFQLLTELFPEVDLRILKAVAIEHCNDADAAVNDVVSEVLPYLSKQPMASSGHLEENRAGLHDEADHRKETDLLRVSHESQGKSVASSEEPRVQPKKFVNHTFTNTVHNAESTREELAQNSPSNQSSSPVVNSKQFQGNGKFLPSKPISQEEDIRSGSNVPGVLSNGSVHEENTKCFQLGTDVMPDSREMQSLWDKCQDRNIDIWTEQNSAVTVSALSPKNCVLGNADVLVLENFDASLDGNPIFVESNRDGVPLKEKDSVVDQELKVGNADGPMFDDCDMVLRSADASKAARASSETQSSVVEETRAADADGIDSEISDETKSQHKSKQEIDIELLEEIIESAKDNKKTLFSAMESVIDMMTEVDLQERDAQRAQEEAAVAGLDILHQVEELKCMLVHAEEANDMRAGEVFGEKAILATEARELQSRLLNLSDERDKTLTILDEMRQNLEARLAAAKELREAAEKEKLEKEDSARSLLAEQQALMEKVVREAKLLEEEAEENSKLRDFLMDRGRLVDALRGEIYVTCKDAWLLKDKFDKRVPLSESFSSSETSCVLASSGSSLKSKGICLTENPGEATMSPKETSPASSIHGKSPKSGPREISPASSVSGKSPERIPQGTATGSSINEQSPNKSPKETNPTTSIKGQPPNNSHVNWRMIGTSIDDWELFEY